MKEGRKLGVSMVVGICIGAAIGNVGLGLCLGICIGAAIESNREDFEQ